MRSSASCTDSRSRVVSVHHPTTTLHLFLLPCPVLSTGWLKTVYPSPVSCPVSFTEWFKKSTSITRRRFCTFLLFHVQSLLQGGSKLFTLLLFHAQSLLQCGSKLFTDLVSISSPVYLVAPKTSTSTLRRLFTFLLFHVQSRLQGGTKSEFTLFDCLHL